MRDVALAALMVGAVAVGGSAPHQTAVDPLTVFGLVVGSVTAGFGAVRWVRESAALGGRA